MEARASSPVLPGERAGTPVLPQTILTVANFFLPPPSPYKTSAKQKMLACAGRGLKSILCDCNNPELQSTAAVETGNPSATTATFLPATGCTEASQAGAEKDSPDIPR